MEERWTPLLFLQKRKRLPVTDVCETHLENKSVSQMPGLIVREEKIYGYLYTVYNHRAASR